MGYAGLKLCLDFDFKYHICAASSWTKIKTLKEPGKTRIFGFLIGKFKSQITGYANCMELIEGGRLISVSSIRNIFGLLFPIWEK